MTANLQPERYRVDVVGYLRQMPAHVEAIIGGEHAAVEDLERRLQQRRPGALQEQWLLLRKDNLLSHTVGEPEIRPARQRYGATCPCDTQTDTAGPLEKGATRHLRCVLMEPRHWWTLGSWGKCTGAGRVRILARREPMELLGSALGTRLEAEFGGR